MPTFKNIDVPLTQQRLHELLDLPGDRSHGASSERASLGSVAGSPHDFGYVRIRLVLRSSALRSAYLRPMAFYRPRPSQRQADNSIDNLREATKHRTRQTSKEHIGATKAPVSRIARN